MDELELAVVGQFLQKGTSIDDLCAFIAHHALEPDCFTDTNLRKIYEFLLARKDPDAAKRWDKAEEAFGSTYIVAAHDAAPCDPDKMEDNIRRLAERGRQAILNRFKGVSLGELAEPIPEEEDSNALIHDRWMRRGQATLLVSMAGTGKSVLSMQLMYAFALGRETLGLKPVRPMKIAVFQTEDDAQELADFRASMREGYKTIHHWTDEDLAKAEANVTFYDAEGRTGAAFAEQLRTIQAKMHYDLVIINPLLGVAGFDIADNRALTEFLRQQIDPVIKSEKAPCALLIVHHTTKPPAQQARSVYGRDSYTMYIGAGGAELANWMRAMLAVLPEEREPGHYLLVAAKRGDRLGWINDPTVKCSLPARRVRHATPEEGLLFWLDDDAPVVKSAPAKDPDLRLKETVNALADELKHEPRTLTDAHKHAKKKYGRTFGSAAYDEVRSHPEAHGLVVQATGASTQRLIGGSTAVEKRLQGKTPAKARDSGSAPIPARDSVFGSSGISHLRDSTHGRQESGFQPAR